jgi:hypothetical protein
MAETEQRIIIRRVMEATISMVWRFSKIGFRTSSRDEIVIPLLLSGE